MSNFPFLSRLSRPAMMALSGAIALVVIAGLMFAAIPRGSDDADAEAKVTATIEATEIEVASATVDTVADVATPDEAATGDATPAAATLTASTPSALIGGGWGSGPDGDAGSMRAYPGPGPQGDAAEVAWKLDIPEGYEGGQPVVYGNRLLVTATSQAFGGNLTVYELESGDFLWSYADSHDFSSPFVATGRVFLTAADSLVALSLETGEVLWTQRIDASNDDTGLSTPDADGEEQPASLSDPVADGNVAVVTLGSTVIALDAETGAELWRHDFAGTTVYTPRLVGDIVFVTSYSAVGEDATTSVDRYHGLSLETGSEIWRQDAVKPMERTASADAGVVIVSDYRDGDVEPRIFDARTGSPVTIAEACEGVRTPRAVGDTVACGSGIDALTGAPLPVAAAWPEDAIAAASTADTLYLTTGTQVIAVDLASGETRWSLDLATVKLDDGQTLMNPISISVGDNAMAVYVYLEDAENEEGSTAIWIVGGVVEPAATPISGASPAASPAAGATPEGGQ